MVQCRIDVALLMVVAFRMRNAVSLSMSDG